MSRIKSQTIFLDSSQGSLNVDKPWEWTANCEPGLICCGPDEFMTLTLERFMTVADWDWVPKDARFTIADDSGAAPRVVLLPRGNPKLQKIAEAITSSKLQCTYDQASNRFVFTSAFDFELMFPSLEVARILGFSELHVGPHMTITSSQPIKPLPIDSIAVHVQGVCPTRSGYNATNIANQHVTSCSMLGVIPVDARPYTLLDWQNQGSVFTMVLEDKQLSSMTFMLTNWKKEPLTQLGQHYMFLRVDTFQKQSKLEAYVSELASTVNIMKVLQLAQHLV